MGATCGTLLMADFDPAKLRAARDKKKLNQTQLADAVGVKQATISRYESGEDVPSAGVLFRIADVLGIDCNSLRDDKPPARSRRKKVDEDE